MKFISFNINGLRARLHQLQAIIEQHQPDVIGLQETKVQDADFPVEDLQQFGYHLSYHGQKSHYGVALLTKAKPLSYHCGLPTDDDDAQCRLITTVLPTEHGELRVINGYFPQGENRDHPLKFAAKAKFYQDLKQYLSQFDCNNELILVMGDMNVAPTDNDVGFSKASQKRWLDKGVASFLPEERQWLQQLLALGFVDTYRQINPEINNQFSFFDYRRHSFDSNSGMRIDLILASTKLAHRCVDAGIDYYIRSLDKPSDHAPIWTTFELMS